MSDAADLAAGGMDEAALRRGGSVEAGPAGIEDAAGASGRIFPDKTLVVLSCLLAIAVLTIAYVAAEIILPLVLAFVLKLLLQPGMRLLERLHIPRALAALVLIVAVFSVIVGLGAAVAGPASAWAEKLPAGLPRLEERLQFLSRPIKTLQAFLHQIDGGAGGSADLGLTETLFRGTQHFAGGFFETILILFFLLVSGDTFLRRFVEVLPRFSDKRQVVALSQQVEENISAYLVTITVMNAAVGIATGIAMWACGLGDPVLWGVLAFLLNFVPIMGPVFGIVLFFFAGLLTMDGFWPALMPAGLYLGIHLVEGEMITPMLLARRFTLNPVLVIISLIFWFWMWGAPGAILAVPLLAVAKIICDGIRPLNAIGHFLEG
ncbi:AI-2E family transporter [Labrys wisconsinensis]|uniref:PurR-regulated permease PerM n=1 Tax=Labrys wisconsinensis TaxID=425677 RepID=A0ABU0JGC3_9HYPH|nr:AI-2E family transporter [Labrys wisconsinensis]MDQ0472453.1 putative PurR-regulated permease PerM [Labrys wisconsinensis]